MKTGYRTTCRLRRTTALLLAVALTTVLWMGMAMAKTYDISPYRIELDVTDEGNYVITERITYRFQDGTFTTGNRRVPRKGFDSLRFVSLTGVDVDVETVDFKDSGDLRVDWTYAPTDDTATFVLTYEATGGLRSKDGRNVIDWNPVGPDWTVPITNIDVAIRLPEAVEDIRVDPPADVVSITDGRVINLHRSNLPPKTFYHVIATFPEIIEVVTPPPRPYLPWIIGALALGVVLAVLDGMSLNVDRVMPAHSGPEPESLTWVEMALLVTKDFNRRRRGITATVFNLAQNGHIRLHVQPGTVWGSGGANVEVLTRDGASRAERHIIDALEQRKTLKTFAADSKVFSQVLKMGQDSLEKKGFVSAENTKMRNRMTASAFLPILIAVAALIVMAFADRPEMWLGIGILAIVVSIGRFVKASRIPVLTAKGLFTKQATETYLDETMARLEDDLVRNPGEALAFLFGNLPALTLHNRFTSSKIQRLKKEVRHVENVTVPEWILPAGGDGEADAKDALQALTAMEAVDLMFTALIITAASTGSTTVSGVGAGGSGAGGGGGGAG